jgi:peroxiredoxin
MKIQPGTPAPNFQLRAHDRSTFSKSDLEGRKSLLVFIPLPFTRTCEAEMCAIRDHRAQLNDLDANVVAITCDTVAVNGRWADENGFEFPVLSDFWPHGEVCRAYGTFNETLGVADRSTFVIAAEGIVRSNVTTADSRTVREFDTSREALAAI